ncbi:MAG: ATP-binding protein [Desulfobulbaceae bacterium]|nr:ATP-binding protein [Desulfobulbaceae bacterium]
MKKFKGLKSLREKMLAIQSGDYDVEAENPKIIRCWERLNCKKNNCPAFGKLRCWSIAGTCCHGEVTGEFAKNIKDCRECVVYKESCGDDIGELIEAFNLMVKDIKYTFNERVRSDQEKAKSDRLMELSDMAAGVAHETRNPLHSIGMATSFLKKKYQDELMSEFLGIIEEEVKKLNDLTAIFLNFSNPGPLRLEPCDINIIAEAVITDFADFADQRQISIKLRHDEHLPEIVSDLSRIRACLYNLVENALEASAAGDTILVSIKNSNGTIMFAVQDHGTGISAGEQEKIFKPFYTTKTNGPGLGLAIVERSIKELGGTVKVKSTPGKGATFSVFIPVMDSLLPSG